MPNLPQISVKYWRYEPGGDGNWGIKAGWRCFIFQKHGSTPIDDWLEHYMTGEYECEFKFNSGDPAYITFIAEEKDAMLFMLVFGVNGNVSR